MKKLNALVVLIILFIIGFAIPPNFIVMYVILLIVLEFLCQLLIKNLRKKFQWLITKEDEEPSLDKEGLEKFFLHGYDPELGWIRKPNTEKDEIGKFGKTKYKIDADGARHNPNHSALPKKISCYGDSFAFCRQVNDNETWEWHLSELTHSNVLNFAVGNYGLDQALLRLKREYPKNKTKIVLIGVVPSTIVRILSVWKHYNEFGNTFGFKPRFLLNGKLIPNPINSQKKFFSYKRYLPQIRKNDYFYYSKFKAEMIEFPYLVSILSQPFRNLLLILLVLFDRSGKDEVYPAPMKVIMDINLKLRCDLFKKKEPVELLRLLVKDFAGYGKKKFTPVLVWMPQKDDLLFIRKKGNYYKHFLDSLDIPVIDLTKHLIDRKDLDSVYSDDNKYGGHYSSKGNKLIANIIYKELRLK